MTTLLGTEKAQSEAEVEEERRRFYAERAVEPSAEVLRAGWDALSFNDQLRIWDQFAHDCIDGSREPSDHWYPLLMPRMLDGYVGD